MKKLLISLAIIAAGLAGYKIGFTISKKKYEGLADEEVESVKRKLEEHYESKIPTKKEEKKKEKKVESNSPIDIAPTRGTKPPKKDYGKQYRSESDQERIPGSPDSPQVIHLKKEEVDTTKPYVITSEDFQESEFECVTLFYTADKVLTDDDYNQIDNIGIVGGYPVLEQMGHYDADCLYVRDNKNGIDYEILLEERTYDRIKPLGVVDEY